MFFFRLDLETIHIFFFFFRIQLIDTHREKRIKKAKMNKIASSKSLFSIDSILNHTSSNSNTATENPEETSSSSSSHKMKSNHQTVKSNNFKINSFIYDPW